MEWMGMDHIHPRGVHSQRSELASYASTLKATLNALVNPDCVFDLKCQCVFWPTMTML